MHVDPFLLEMLAPLKEQARERLRDFGEQPLGRFVKIAGQRVIACKVEGRTVTLHDLKAVVDEAVACEEETKR